MNLAQARIRSSIPASIADVEALRAIIPPFPPPSAPFVVEVVPFTYLTPSPLVLHALLPGQTILRGAIRIDTAFDGIGAFLKLGTPGTPGLVLDAQDSDPALVSQYEDDVMFTFSAPDSLILTLFSGASTQGKGVVLFEIEGP